jgi:hypothetical protein
MRFNSKLDKRYKIILLILFILLFGACSVSYFIYNDPKDALIQLIFASVILGLIICINKTTYYIIEGNQLICKTLFFNKTIAIDSIRKIEKGNSLGSIYKIATSFNGITIHFNKFDDIFISPDKLEDFCKELNIQNSNIVYKPETSFL